MAAPLCACHFGIIDQRTFESTRNEPQSAAAASPITPPIAVADLQSGWQKRLGDAARSAIERDPTAHFDLIAPVPLGGNVTARAVFRRQQADFLAQADTALQEAGIDADRIRLGYRGDAGSPAHIVELHLRPGEASHG